MSYGMRWASAVAAALLWVGATAAQPPGRGGPPGPGGPGGQAQRALDDLELTGDAQNKAQRLVDAYQDRTRRQLDRSRAEVLGEVRPFLTDAQFRDFQASLDRRPAGPGGRGGRGVSDNDLVERVMAYDKNKTGKVTKEDLPERMQHLVDMGDTNKDGALDREELKALAARMNRDGGPGPGRGPGGRGPGGPPAPPEAARRALDDLELTGAQLDFVRYVVNANLDATRTQMDQMRDELLEQMKGVLTERQLRDFRDAVSRRPGPGRGPGRGPGFGPDRP